MSKLQGIVVLCIFIILAGSFYVVSLYQGGRLTTDSDTSTGQIDPPSLDLETGPSDESVDSTEPVDSTVPEDSTEPVESDLPKVEEKAPAVSSFDECVSAGYPVFYTYPGQCIADDVTFVQEIEE